MITLYTFNINKNNYNKILKEFLKNDNFDIPFIKIGGIESGTINMMQSFVSKNGLNSIMIITEQTFNLVNFLY